MISGLNYFINLTNLFLLFSYFIFINLDLVKKEYEVLIIFIISINLILKLYNWYNFNISKKQNLYFIINSIFYSDRFIKLNILVFSIMTPIYMIFQRESLMIDLFIEKLSFFLIFLFALFGFYLEFFILESKSEK